MAACVVGSVFFRRAVEGPPVTSCAVSLQPKKASRVQPRLPALRPASGSPRVAPRPASGSPGVALRPRLLPALTPLGPGTRGRRQLVPSQPQATLHSAENVRAEDLQTPVPAVPRPEERGSEAGARPGEAEGDAAGPGGAGAQGVWRASTVFPAQVSPARSPPGAAGQSPQDSGAPARPHRQPRVRDAGAAPEPAVPGAAGGGCRGVKVRSPGKRPDILSRVEARDITEMANKAAKEPEGCVSNAGLLASLARSASREAAQSAQGPGRLRPPRPPSPPRPRLQPADPGASAVPFPVSAPGPPSSTTGEEAAN